MDKRSSRGLLQTLGTRRERKMEYCTMTLVRQTEIILCACVCVCLQSAGGRVASLFSALNHPNVITIECCQPAAREPSKEGFCIPPKIITHHQITDMRTPQQKAKSPPFCTVLGIWNLCSLARSTQRGEVCTACNNLLWYNFITGDARMDSGAFG